MYTTNFKPKYLNNNKLYNNSIYCKKFLLFFIILEYLIKKSNKNRQISFKLVTLPKQKTLVKLLRAPNRSKKSQLSLYILRFKILICLNFLSKGLMYIKNHTKVLEFLIQICKKLKFFESNILLLHSLKVRVGYNKINTIG